VKTIARSSDTYLARKGEQPRLQRNLDPVLHPLAKAREYTRALNATKLERYFAKPFIAQLGNGHIDGVYCIAKDWRKLSSVASGSGDGVVKAWDLVSREEAFSIRAHDGIVNGLCYTVEGRLLSCSTDKLIKLWEPGTKEVHLCADFSNPSLFKRTLVLQGTIPLITTAMKLFLLLRPRL
jgi:WD repeat and SOF domain-containing protein 1